ncbi:putative methyltransferase-domain-containing protein [Jackrogersella minutella]|nr:putative methyltransferase-domain-containing protein [Jackrogersella minutella]
MHYIRLLRPAKFDASERRRPIISLLITITTDLGDSFLSPSDHIDLTVSADDPAGQSVILWIAQPFRWVAGMRVLDIKVPVTPHLKKDDVTCTIRIQPAAQSLGLIKSSDVLPWSLAGGSPESRGLIMPATVEMANGVCSPVSLRTFQLDTGSQPSDRLSLHLEEDIGESIARHIWDAGIVTASFIADACSTKDDIRYVLPIDDDKFSVLELGSGVGILGITLARIVEMAAAIQGQKLTEATVMLTDLPEAEERARSNILRLETVLSQKSTKDPVTKLQYENLDWDEGKHGRFGPLVSARPWNLVVLSDCTYNVDSLPALVGTLNALEKAKLEHKENRDHIPFSVILATKPRHSSEQELFGLLKANRWRYTTLKSIPLLKLEGENEVVDIYQLEKGRGTT